MVVAGKAKISVTLANPGGDKANKLKHDKKPKR